MKKILIFHPFLVNSGGSERITLEEEKYLKSKQVDTSIVAFRYKPVFNDLYRPNIIELNDKYKNKVLLFFYRIFALRKLIKGINPTIIDACNIEGCFYLFFATLFSKYRYFSQVPSSGCDNIIYFGENIFIDILAARIFSKAYFTIRMSQRGHSFSLPQNLVIKGNIRKIFINIAAIIVRLSVRKAIKLFVLSEQVKWEIKQLYNKNSIVLKGAYSNSTFPYTPTNDVRAQLNLTNKKIIFSLSRLDKKKRIDIIINAFHSIINEKDINAVLVIGGDGPYRNTLEELTLNLGISHLVIFTGFLNEKTMLDYYFYCDVFISADYSDFDISTYTAIGFDKNIVWSIDNELDNDLLSSGKIFPAEISSESFASCLIAALSSPNNIYIKKDYSWENYFYQMYMDWLNS